MMKVWFAEEPKEADPYTDDIDKWVGRLLSFLAGVGFLFTCFALGLWGVK